MNVETLAPWTDEGCLVLAFFLKPNKFFDQ